ncbi:MAG: hypothetical protein L0387_22410 [Acidobacteria bacterium]|nr:hypothetical protein [Acidobacteriota bacterium]MCI0624362.1 hypothetical protein [Acidobacteriota bacterium]MCI0723324.1 hypothetical protein [Acidobacteriota bacterium]
MCYASAEGHSRNARADEVLVVRRQPHGSNWLVSPEDASTAVCLRTGTEVELLYIPEETQRRFGLPVEVKTNFRTDDWWRRDVFVLRNGRKVVLRKLQEGQVIRVLSVPAGSAQEEVSLQEEQTENRIEVERTPRHPLRR